jgi:transposase
VNLLGKYKRHEIPDSAWDKIEPMMPRSKGRGRRWKDHRTVLNGILWKFKTGAPWRDIPEQYGPWKTCYYRFTRWQQEGLWERLLQHVQTHVDAVSEIEWIVSVDSTTIRAHQHAAGAPKEPLKKGAQHFPK